MIGLPRYGLSEMIRIPASVQTDMETHALDEYPFECCGYLTCAGDPDTWAVHRCRNIQNELHVRDPERYPRDARTAYVFSEEDMERLFFGEFDRSDERIIGFYHSHPDHPAYFSEKDRMEALVDWIQPEPFYLVISVIEGSVRDMKMFSWNEQTQAFDELEIEYDAVSAGG